MCVRELFWSKLFARRLLYQTSQYRRPLFLCLNPVTENLVRYIRTMSTQKVDQTVNMWMEVIQLGKEPGVTDLCQGYPDMPGTWFHACDVFNAIRLPRISTFFCSNLPYLLLFAE